MSTSEVEKELVKALEHLVRMAKLLNEMSDVMLETAKRYKELEARVVSLESDHGVALGDLDA